MSAAFIHTFLLLLPTGLSVSVQWRRPEVALLASGGVGLVARCELLVDYSRCPGRDELVVRLAGLRVTSLQPAPMVRYR